MPDFTAAYSSGVTLEQWTDPPLGNVPTRINPSAAYPHRRHVGSTGVQVELTATVGGVVGEVDANLGGRLFIGDFAEAPEFPFPPITNPAGQSSVQRFTPQAVGHYTFILRRTDGGGVFVHVDVE